MTPSQLKQANENYLDMFADDISPDSLAKLETCDSLEELEELEDELSSGEYDCAEYVLAGR